MSPSIGYARHFAACNRHDLSRFVPLLIGGTRYGFVLKTLADFLRSDADMFVSSGDGVALHPIFATYEARTAALAKATGTLAAHYNKPIRNELYPVICQWGDEPVAEIDRVAVPWFGVRAWGVHVNGFVRKADGLHLWIGERAADRPADPGKLDNLIGGGQPIGLTVEENLCKEAKEEAGIDAALALTARATRTLDYRVERNDGLRSDTLFIYDLELPPDFIPRNTDGEVASFQLLPLAKVASIVRDTDRFKFNCNIVIIDFLVRHRLITPQDSEYAELMQWLQT
jgi:8-oxo-dGTP pyrophosphatase MutT (NUDIX family)